MTSEVMIQWCEKWNVPVEALDDLCRLHGVPTADTGATSEARTQSELRLAAAQAGFALWRNNNGACMDDTGRLIRYGLGHDSKRLNDVWKSSDLIGIGPHGRFVACEVKHPGWTKPENDRDRAQAAFLGQVNALGGIGFFATHKDHLQCAFREIAGAQ